MYLTNYLKTNAKQYPDKTAIVYNNERVTYSVLDELSDILAEKLIEKGITHGDRIALLLENSPVYIISFFAILKANAVVVPLNTQLVSRELEAILNDCSPKLMITNIPHQNNLKDLAISNSILLIDQGNFEKCECSSHSERSPQGGVKNLSSANGLAMIIYTSGTTGKPKGVMLSHANLNANAESIVEYLNLKPTDSIMVILPFYYSYGTSLLTTHIKAGATLVIDNRFLYPNLVLDNMEKEEVTGFAGVPSHYNILLRKSALRKYKLSKLRYVTQAGGAMSPAMIKEFAELMPHAKFYVMYGQTEASARLTYLDPKYLCHSQSPRFASQSEAAGTKHPTDIVPESQNKLGSIGKAIPGVEITILNEQGQKVKPGEIGEIVARGKNIMLGYWNSHEETQLVLKKEGLWTGDLAKIDDDGFIYLISRKKEMIKSGANRISPLEIENIVCQMPGVIECAAVGIPDEILGETIKLCVVKNGIPFAENDLLLFCKQNLAAYKIPKVIEFRESLPKTTTGKIKRTELM